MYRVPQGEQYMVQLKNPVVAGLRDSRTPPERPCYNRVLSPLASRVVSTCTVRGLYFQVNLQ